MTTHQHGPSRVRRLTGAAVLALSVLVWSSTSPTLSAWTTGVVGNSDNTAAPASLAFSHSAGSCALGPRVSTTTTCGGSVLPTVASSATAVTGTDSITNNGTAPGSSLTSSVSGASCAPVRLDNAKTATNVMLPRYGTSFRAGDPFGATNAITLDGTGYAAAIATDTTRSTPGQTYGAGVWFKAAAGQSGPLLSLDTSPIAAATTNGDDRTVFLGSDGRLTFSYSTGGNKLTTLVGGLNDGAWHFVYATLSFSGTISLSATASLSVGTQAPVSATTLLTGLAPVTGYWHLGWGSTALMGAGTTSFFTGSLSNFVVFSSGTAPGPPTATQLGSQASFTTWAAGVTDSWLLGDSGTTTYAGTQPVIGTTSPCTYLSIGWAFTNPAGTAVTSRTLAAFASGTGFPVGAAPGPSATQTSTVSITRAAGWVTYVGGLRLLVPVTYTVRAGSWALGFTWSSADSVVLG